MQVAASVSQAATGLFGVGSDMAKFLSVVALGSVCLDLYDTMAETGKSEYFLTFLVSGEHHKKLAEVVSLAACVRQRLAVIWRLVTTLKPSTTSSLDICWHESPER